MGLDRVGHFHLSVSNYCKAGNPPPPFFSYSTVYLFACGVDGVCIDKPSVSACMADPAAVVGVSDTAVLDQQTEPSVAAVRRRGVEVQMFGQTHAQNTRRNRSTVLYCKGFLDRYCNDRPGPTINSKTNKTNNLNGRPRAHDEWTDRRNISAFRFLL